MLQNPLFRTDGYKFSHAPQYPKGTTGSFHYWSSRGGLYPELMTFGMQYIIKRYLLDRITFADVLEMKTYCERYGVGFESEGWQKVARHHGGLLPVRIRCAPEGTVIPVGNVVFTVESTDPELFWVASWVETQLMRFWYPATVATRSYHMKKLLWSFLKDTADDPKAEIPYKLHDFGARGVETHESASLGGAAHLVNFDGTDTLEGAALVHDYYGGELFGASINASEHSTMTMWGKEREVDAMANMIDTYGKPGAVFACVSDQYDIFHACEKIWGEKLKEKLVASGATLVVRPDSGDPLNTVMKCLGILEEKFGFSYNTKGFKVLNHVRVIQGDGVDEEAIRSILSAAKQAGYSATNLAFGCGGYLLQKVDRDTQKCAYKCSEGTVHGKSVEVYKDPVTDPGKRSLRGRVDLVYRDGKYQTVSGTDNFGSVLQIVYENGKLVKDRTFSDIRARANEHFFR